MRVTKILAKFVENFINLYLEQIKFKFEKWIARQFLSSLLLALSQFDRTNMDVVYTEWCTSLDCVIVFAVTDAKQLIAIRDTHFFGIQNVNLPLN